MSTANKSLSDYVLDDVPPAGEYRFALVTAEWNKEVTSALKEGAYNTLLRCGAIESNIYIASVPGTFELTAAAAMLADNKIFDAIICIGCVIQGETRHFEFICNSVANGLASVSIAHNIPVIFGVLTTDTNTQAMERSGGVHGNKGVEAAVTAIKMAAFKKNLRTSKLTGKQNS